MNDDCKHQWTEDSVEEEEGHMYMTCALCGIRGPELTDAEIESALKAIDPEPLEADSPPHGSLSPGPRHGDMLDLMDTKAILGSSPRRK